MVRLIAALVLALATSGCFVFEELDKGAAIMDAHSPKNLDDPKAKAKAKPADEEPGQLAQWVDTMKGWWGEASEPKKPVRDPSDVPVACRIGGSTRFMHRSDCLVQGGRPG